MSFLIQINATILISSPTPENGKSVSREVSKIAGLNSKVLLMDIDWEKRIA